LHPSHVEPEGIAHSLIGSFGAGFLYASGRMGLIPSNSSRQARDGLALGLLVVGIVGVAHLLSGGRQVLA
jgi:hypothetical protein